MRLFIFIIISIIVHYVLYLYAFKQGKESVINNTSGLSEKEKETLIKNISP